MTGLTSVEDGAIGVEETEARIDHETCSEQLVDESTGARGVADELSVTGDTSVELRIPFVKLGPGIEVE